ncbi:hypothetical protein [Pseudomonas entomophila]|uniref:hypothetical protein n=1 Tax=Pseudomonas entomophila TaxID=312306 RepID=UPI002404BA86|nr:hypothetical protein [Pseudomonas entomophila]
MSTYRHRGLRYQVYRSQARMLAHEAFSTGACSPGTELDAEKVRFEPIGHGAIEALQLWGRQTHHFPWEEVPRWTDRDFKGLDVSLWSARELCGLCYASPRRSSHCIKIILLEGNPGPTNPLRGLVASLSLLAVIEYARMLRCSQIEVQQPDPGAEPLYLSLGFSRDPAGRLVMPVGALTPQITVQVSEVSMQYPTSSRKAALIKRYTAEAIALAGGITDQQRHILEVAFKEGREKEPEGILAGPRSGPIDYEWSAAASK